MFFQTVLVALLLLAFGALLSVAGFRLFVILLPIYGFFFGFMITAQSIQQLGGGGFLATVSSWVFGVVVGLLFAIAAYFYYYAAIAILAATVGYELGVGVIAGLGITLGFIQFLIGVLVAVVFVGGVILLNLPRLFIIILTSVVGAGMIVSGVLVAIGQLPITALQFGVVGSFLHLSWLWALVFLALVGAGIVVQLLIPAAFKMERDEMLQTAQQEAATGAQAPSSDAAPLSPSAGSQGISPT
jgi:hypothetical protein